MPANYEMTWEPGPRRWRRMQGGRYLTVSVRQLRKYFNESSIQDTKEGSYQWANRWWRERSNEPAEVAAHERRSGFGDDGAFYMDLTGDEALAFMIREIQDRDLELPEEVIEAVIGKPRLKELRRGLDTLLHPVKPPVDRTVGHLVGRYLEMVLSRHRAGEIGVSEYSNNKASLLYFRDYVGIDLAIDSLNADRWDAYYLHLIGENAPRSIRSRRKHFNYARNFLRWLDDLGINTAPPNLSRKQYRFKGGSQAVPTITTEVIKQTIQSAKGQLQLHLLLMLNCGFTQQDIADLHPSEVDWEQGRIRRKRSKTSDRDKVPVVDYILWRETFDLLIRYRSSDPDHVLVTESGKAWLRDHIHDDGARSRTDAIQSNYRRLEVEGKQPLKMFRKASSTLLDGCPDHGRYAVHFLGHAPDIAHRHYISSNGASFDAAIKWLGKQFGY